MSKLFRLWTDGSYRHKSQAGGAGYVVIDPRGTRTEHCLTLPGLTKSEFAPYGSDIAEMNAAAYALRHVYSNATQAQVLLHMDCQGVIDCLKERSLSKKQSGIPPLLAPFQLAVSIMKAMSSVTIIKVGPKNENLIAANRLAQTASSP